MVVNVTIKGTAKSMERITVKGTLKCVVRITVKTVVRIQLYIGYI